MASGCSQIRALRQTRRPLAPGGTERAWATVHHWLIDMTRLLVYRTRSNPSLDQDTGGVGSGCDPQISKKAPVHPMGDQLDSRFKNHKKCQEIGGSFGSFQSSYIQLHQWPPDFPHPKRMDFCGDLSLFGGLFRPPRHRADDPGHHHEGGVGPMLLSAPSLKLRDTNGPKPCGRMEVSCGYGYWQTRWVDEQPNSLTTGSYPISQKISG